MGLFDKIRQIAQMKLQNNSSIESSNYPNFIDRVRNMSTYPLENTVVPNQSDLVNNIKNRVSQKYGLSPDLTKQLQDLSINFMQTPARGNRYWNQPGLQNDYEPNYYDSRKGVVLDPQGINYFKDNNQFTGAIPHEFTHNVWETLPNNIKQQYQQELMKLLGSGKIKIEGMPSLKSLSNGSSLDEAFAAGVGSEYPQIKKIYNSIGFGNYQNDY